MPVIAWTTESDCQADPSRYEHWCGVKGDTATTQKGSVPTGPKAAEGRVPRVVRHQKAAAEDSLARWDGNRLLCGDKA
jgi:hypothetical protein